jgi:hypothetical protein
VYVSLSILFFSGIDFPVASDNFGLFSAISGPPILLAWGARAIFVFLVATCILALFIHKALSPGKHRFIYWSLSLATWMFFGFLAFAISI